MNVNLKLETANFCYVYDKYKIVEIKGKRYIMPEKGATKKSINITENMNDILIEILNIGKKVFYEDELEDSELINFFAKYGMLGFMTDLAINKYYILAK